MEAKDPSIFVHHHEQVTFVDQKAVLSEEVLSKIASDAADSFLEKAVQSQEAVQSEELLAKISKEAADAYLNKELVDNRIAQYHAKVQAIKHGGAKAMELHASRRTSMLQRLDDNLTTDEKISILSEKVVDLLLQS